MTTWIFISFLLLLPLLLGLLGSSLGEMSGPAQMDFSLVAVR